MKVAIAGVGYTTFSAESESSTLELASEACANALDDAGMDRNEVDGVGSFSVMHDSVPSQAVASSLGLGETRLLLDLDLGGQAPCYLVSLAASAISSGQADSILLFRSMKGRSGSRVGTMAFDGGGGQFRYPIGYSAYMMYIAMWAQRFLYETSQGADDLASVVFAQREFSVLNERAFRRSPISEAAYFDAPLVVAPFRAADCTVEVDGACAVLVTSLERARDLRRSPAIVASSGYRAGPRSGLDIGDHLLWRDYTRNYTSLLVPELLNKAGLKVTDLEFAEIYDCFSSTVLMALEGSGICNRGESGAFVRSGATSLRGALPTNTNGGLLCEGYLHGMNTLCEAVTQIQGRAGERQVSRHDVCLVTSGALMDGSALILTSDS
jgi:acetyl-CoA acetyltransferase